MVSIEVNRGSAITLVISATVGDENYTFQPGDVVRLSITERKNENKVVLRKDVEVNEETEEVESNDSNRLATLTCAVSADKTSFVVL